MHAVFALAVIGVACGKGNGGAGPDAGDVTDAATDGGSLDGASATDAGDASEGDAGDASASDASDASDADADGGRRWTHYEFPETGYPNGWLVASQGNSPNNWAASSVLGTSTLNLFTEDPAGGIACVNNTVCAASQCVAGTCRQRVKQKSPRLDFAFGAYEWRVYVPAFTPADAQVSIGAFVYADDAHELDFECGPGTATARASAALDHLDGTTGPALATDMLCYLTSQGNPAASKAVALPVATWHTLALVMSPDASGRYEVTWSIDGTPLQTVALAYGPLDACDMYTAGRKCTWQAFISAENLGFIGDTYPTARNDAHFDWFRHGE